MNKTYKISFVLLLIFLVSGCSSVYTEILIPAEPKEVWSVLMDEELYKDWNPTLIPIEDELKEGNELKYKMIDPNGESVEVNSNIENLVEEKELNQYGGMWGILTFDHYYVLEKVEEGTKVIQKEDYAGIGVWFWDNSWVEPAYKEVNEALKNRVEELKLEQKK